MCVKDVLFWFFLRRGLSGIHLLPGRWEPQTCFMPRSRLSGTEIRALNSQAFSYLWTSVKTRKASLSLFVPPISPCLLERGKGLLVPSSTSGRLSCFAHSPLGAPDLLSFLGRHRYSDHVFPGTACHFWPFLCLSLWLCLLLPQPPRNRLHVFPGLGFLPSQTLPRLVLLWQTWHPGAAGKDRKGNVLLWRGSKRELAEQVGWRAGLLSGNWV